jgi:hypothetical protein
MTQWNVQIDWNRDGDFTTTIDDVTARIIRLDWALGMRKPYQEIADNAVLSLKLRNEDQHLSPENASSPLYGKVKPHVPVRVISDDSIERVMWQGWIQIITPPVGQPIR